METKCRIQIASPVARNSILRIILLILTMTFAFNSELSAQEEAGQAAKTDTVQSAQEELSRGERKDSIKTAKIAAGEGILSFLGGPGYTPDLKLLVAVGGLYTFKTNKEDSLIQRSTLNGSFGVTIPSGGIVSKLLLTSFWKQDKMRIDANIWFKNIPDHYWGVGYDNGLNTPRTDSTSAYHRLWWQINPRVMFQLAEDLYAGPVLDFNQTNIKDESEGVLADPYYQEFGPRNFNGGAGAILKYDSRDIPVNAYRGTLLQAMAVFYGRYLGGNNGFWMLDIDFRNYQQLAKLDGQTLAMTVRGRFTQGDIPYAEMSQLGTPTDLRGYAWGRFRHEDMFYFIGEYRHMFRKRSTGKRSKHGLVGWVGGGSIMENVYKIDNFLYNYGVGYRFEVQPRMNVRFDYGFGRDSNGLYFNFTETF
jgi:hypothetical protein